MRDEESGMTCAPCVRIFAKTKSSVDKNASQFLTHCLNYKKEALKRHEKSHQHLKAIERAAAADATGPAQSKGDLALKMLSKDVRVKVGHLMRNAHAIAKHGRPYSDFVWMATLDGMKGVDVGSTYRRDKSCREFVSIIAQVEAEKLKQSVRDARFISIMCDGSTDSAVVEEEMIFVRYIDRGEIRSRFVAVEQVERDDAVSITAAIKQACQTYLGLDAAEFGRKLVGLGSDGAAVMQGRKGGVTGLLRKEQPLLQSVHCSSHRLELAYREVIKGRPQLLRVQTTLEGVFNLYHKSALNRSMLKRACAATNVKYLVPCRVGGTRWMPHTLRALTNFFTSYPGIVNHMQQLQQTTGNSSESKAKARGLLKNILSRTWLLYASMLHDIVATMSTLALVIQRVTCSLAEAYTAVQTTIESLEKMVHT